MAKYIAQLILNMGATFTRSFFTAYQQVIHHNKAGTMSKIDVNRHKMRPDEALKILNIERAVLTKRSLNDRFKTYFELNDPAKGGSFYLQSKIYRAKETLDTELEIAKNAAADAAKAAAAPPPPTASTGSDAASESKQKQQTK